MWKVLCLSLIALLIASASWAVPITFIHIVDGGSFPGSLDPDGAGPMEPVTFEVDQFTITAQGDTADRRGDSVVGFDIEHTSALIEIPGVGNFEFLVPTFSVLSTDSLFAGFAAGPFGSVLLRGPVHPAFETYELVSSIGPIFGDGRLLSWTLEEFMTSGGVLVFEDRSMENAGFEAIVDGGTVPEPGTLAILGLVACLGASPTSTAPVAEVLAIPGVLFRPFLHQENRFLE